MANEISRKLEAIKDEKQEIRASILCKGVLVGEEFRTYSEAIDDINTTPELEEKNITENGQFVPSEGVYGFSKVNVTVAPIQMTQAQYDALATKDPNRVYIIKD